MSQSKLDEVPSSRKKGLTMFVAGVFLLLAGIPSVLEGFYLAAASGLLFGEYVCPFAIGGGCEPTLEAVRSMFWQGTYLLAFGVGSITVGSILLLTMRKRAQGKTGRIFGNRLHKRLVIASALLVVVLSIVFLAPILPFSTTSTSQLPYTTTSGNVCYQNVPSVTNPVFNYNGYESISQSIFHVGNLLYVECTVISGT